MIYKVQCQSLLEFEVKANSRDEAEELGAEMAINKCLYDADGIDFTVTSQEADHE